MRLRYKILPLALGMSIVLSGCGLSSANRNYGHALDAYEDGAYEKAQEYFTQAIKDNPDKAEYHIDYGFTLLQLKNYEEARNQFNYVIMDKDISMVKENNKKAYRGIGISYLLEGNYQEAVTNFDLALDIPKLTDLDTDIMYYKASALQQSGEYEAAVELYTSILERKSEDAQIYNARANLYRILSEYDLSIADYDKAILINPKDFNLYVGKFATLKENGKNAEATAVLEQAAVLEVTDDNDKFELAKVHFYQGKYDIAENELSTCLEAGFTEANYFMGELHLLNKSYEAALTSFNAYIDAGNGVSAMLYNQMLTCYLNLDRLEDANKCLEKAKKLKDSSIQDQLLKNEIIYLEKTGQFEDALTAMEKYIKRYPEDENAQKDYYFLQTRVDVEPLIKESEPTVVKP